MMLLTVQISSMPLIHHSKSSLPVGREINEIFIAELENENKKLEAELNQIIAKTSNLSSPQQVLDQNENSTNPLCIQTAAFPKYSSPIVPAGVSASNSQSLFKLKSSPLNKENLLNLAQNRSRTITTARLHKNNSVIGSFENSICSEGYQGIDKKCKKLELRLIGTQKTIHSLQNAQRVKDEEIEKLKREMKQKQKQIDALTTEREKSNRTEEMRRYLKLHKEKIEQLTTELNKSHEANNTLQKDNNKLINKLNQQSTLIEKYKNVLDNQMNAISIREE